MTVKKPYVVCHMMSTIDGKIASGIEGVDLLEDFFGIYTKTESHLGGRAWMCGRVTMQMFSSNQEQILTQSTGDIGRENFITSTNADTYILGVDTKGILRWNSNLVQLSTVPQPSQLVIIVTHQTPKEYLSYLQGKQISYIFGGESTVHFELVLSTIQEVFGVEKILLEGGAVLNGSLLEDDLIDEISLLLCPVVANFSKAPAVFENMIGKLDTKKFTLTNIAQQKDGVVWLRYKRNRPLV